MNNIPNPNFEKLRKALQITDDVHVFPDMMVYRMPNKKLAEKAAIDALNVIEKLKLPLQAFHQNTPLNHTFFIKPLIIKI